ncbi:hypothetical protein DCS_00378 [Drechmeria coniospora]|uniref:MYND-type domain-containing protein n=1 Tax=Drechmeria coniospora TaxID=98403 RepID=A0A151GQA5_DRECN|nr:hypothetical protein DCS_00378 [Drechmeria coniospora]KYK59248.1 hypothetical protein DCS_00378 [Drechmeria coniospora]ODA77989.1 hypothetical protein RJ55_06592 [Drechmeria coniospora]
MPLVNGTDLGKPNTLLPLACHLCLGQNGNLHRCSACRTVYYCGKECQVSDRRAHKKACKSVQRARAYHEDEEKKLRWIPGDFPSPDRVFDAHVGRFWAITETRPYMRARYLLVDVLLLCFGRVGGSVLVVEEALAHLLDLMRLARKDQMLLRQQVPSLYIRLGRDQEAYDFMKWFATTVEDPDYDWTDLDRPFLDVENADVFEPLEMPWTRTRDLDLGQAVAMTLIKMRLLLDLEALQNVRVALRGTLPAEIIEMIRDNLVGRIVGARPGLLLAPPEVTVGLARTMKGQVRELHAAVQANSPHLWKLLAADPDSCKLEMPRMLHMYHKHGSRDEAMTTCWFSSAAWHETPGAVAMLRRLIQAG